MSAPRGRPAEPIRAPRGAAISCKGWAQEAALRMLMNNLDPDVAERWEDLVVYGGSGKAARSWEAYHTIVATLRRLEGDETLLIQSGKPVGVFTTSPDAPRVLIANAMLVPAWGDWEHFRRYEAMGLTMYGQMTAGSWIYIGTQGILQGTYETFGACARQHFGGTLAGRLVLSAGLGGMGGAPPLAVTLNGGVGLFVGGGPERIGRRLTLRYLDRATDSPDTAVRRREGGPGRCSSTTGTTSGERRRRRESGTSATPASCRPSSGPSSARGRARSGGSRCPGTPTTSTPPTAPSWTPSGTTPTSSGGSASPRSASRSRACPRGSAGSATASGRGRGPSSTTSRRRDA